MCSAAHLVGLIPKEAHVTPGHGHGLGPGEAFRPAHGLLHLPLGEGHEGRCLQMIREG